MHTQAPPQGCNSNQYADLASNSPRFGYYSNIVPLYHQRDQLLNSLQADPANLSQQSCTHGLSVLRHVQSPRVQIDPHVYRDWLIFEERLKQNYRRLRRKKRRYLTQTFLLSVLALSFGWGSLFGSSAYQFLCRVLFCVCVFSISHTVNNRKFKQSVKFLDQCNRVLYQYRMRLEPNPNALTQQDPTIAGLAKSQSATDLSRGQGISPTAAISGTISATNSKGDAQLLFFPPISESMRRGYVEFKKTYQRKRGIARWRQRQQQLQLQSEKGGGGRRRSNSAKSRDHPPLAASQGHRRTISGGPPVSPPHLHVPQAAETTELPAYTTKPRYSSLQGHQLHQRRKLTAPTVNPVTGVEETDYEGATDADFISSSDDNVSRLSSLREGNPRGTGSNSAWRGP